MPKTKYEIVKEWRKANPEKKAEQDRRWRERHPDVAAAKAKRYRERNLEAVRAREAEAARKRRAADPEGQRRRVRAYAERQRQARIETAGRTPPLVCEVCGEFHLRIVFDHCHASGEFRGWLCDRCNRVLGLIKDNPGFLRKLADYLEAPIGPSDRSATQEATEE